jgi:hypothetical protein
LIKVLLHADEKIARPHAWRFDMKALFGFILGIQLIACAELPKEAPVSPGMTMDHPSAEETTVHSEPQALPRIKTAQENACVRECFVIANQCRSSLPGEGFAGLGRSIACRRQEHECKDTCVGL